jgi:hypothetical protein
MKTVGGANEVMSSMAKGLKAGLAEADSFGDTRDIQALLGHVARVEGKIFDMFEYGRTGTVGSSKMVLKSKAMAEVILLLSILKLPTILQGWVTWMVSSFLATNDRIPNSLPSCMICWTHLVKQLT